MAKKECCESLKIVTARRRENDRTGLMYETLFSRSGKTKPQDVLAIRMHKSKDKAAEHANVTVIVCNYCPFCGKKRA